MSFLDDFGMYSIISPLSFSQISDVESWINNLDGKNLYRLKRSFFLYILIPLLCTEKMSSESTQKDPVQERLDQTASLIKDLQATQKERLSARLPMHLAHVPGPSEKEIQLAQKVTQELKELAKEVRELARREWGERTI